MKSKELAKELVDPFRTYVDRKIHITHDELDQLEANIELFLLRKFDEGREVFRDCCNKKEAK